MRLLSFSLLTVAVLTLIGCSTVTVRSVDLQPPNVAPNPIPEDELLDIGIVVFDANITKLFDDTIADNITPEIRRAEANWVATYIKNYLQSTGNWGAVRVIPEASYGVEVYVTGKILHSDGERLILMIQVRDARGELWFEEQVETLASKFAYEDTVPDTIDPFQETYRHLANKMLDYYLGLPKEEIKEIREISFYRFAAENWPEQFGDYVTVSASENYTLNRLPTENDPNVLLLQDARERQFFFIDTLSEHFDRFGEDMRRPYQDWRQETYDVAIEYRESRSRTRTRMITGTALVLSGAAGQRSSNTFLEYGGYAAVIGGAGELVGSVQDRANMVLSQSKLEELGAVAAREISPTTIELENAIYTLQGTYEEQWAQARKLFRIKTLRDLGFDVDYQLDDLSNLTDEEFTPGDKPSDEFIQESE